MFLQLSVLSISIGDAGESFLVHAVHPLINAQYCWSCLKEESDVILSLLLHSAKCLGSSDVGQLSSKSAATFVV
jgi:hypothetical protein